MKISRGKKRSLEEQSEYNQTDSFFKIWQIFVSIITDTFHYHTFACFILISSPLSFRITSIKLSLSLTFEMKQIIYEHKLEEATDLRVPAASHRALWLLACFVCRFLFLTKIKGLPDNKTFAVLFHLCSNSPKKPEFAGVQNNWKLV